MSVHESCPSSLSRQHWVVVRVGLLAGARLYRFTHLGKAITPPPVAEDGGIVLGLELSLTTDE